MIILGFNKDQMSKMSFAQFSWLCCNKNKEKRKFLEDILPSGYHYKIESFKIVEESIIDKETKLDAIFAVNICDEEEIKLLLADFEKSSQTNYNINKGDRKGTKKIIVSGVRKCIHNIRERTKSGSSDDVTSPLTHGKQTNCPAILNFKLRKTDDHNHDKNCALFPLEISISHIHNHSIESANAFKFHNVAQETKDKFIELFEAAHSASSAYQEYKNFLMQKHKENYVQVSADRAVMPDYKWVFNFHAEFVKKAFGKINSPEAFEKATQKVQEYNERNGDTLCVIEQMEDNTIVAVCDNLSRRVHEILPQAGDIVYVDATSNLDRQDSKLIKLMTCSPAGGLPLGFVITHSESQKSLEKAFEMLKTVLPENAFHKRGIEKGPEIFMTDDAEAEINALRKVWPNSKLLLCVWHVLNAVWRWLWEAKHQVQKDDRKHLLKIFRSLLYAKNEAEFDLKKAELLSDTKCLKYLMFIKHLDEAYFGRKHAWAISVRNDEKLPTHSTNTSNYIEASFRITKDGQFNRTKAFNLVDLLDILLDDSVYYKKRLNDIGNGRLGAFKNSKSKYILKNKNKIVEDDIFDLGELKFLVQSEKNKDTYYQVDMVSGFCECRAGVNCGPCKHKGAIAKFKNIAEFNILPESDPNMRALYHYIADGKICTNTWYRDLDKPNEITNVAVFVEERTSNATCPTTEEIPNDSEVERFADSDSDEFVNEVTNNDTEDDDDDEKEGTLSNFTAAVDALKTNILNLYNKNLKKGVKFFTKKIQKMAKQTSTSLEKSLFDIGKELNKPGNKLKKKKIGKLIPVQVTAKSRREYKHRGRVVGVAGRRHKDQKSRKQMVVNDDSEIVYHTLPKQKKTKNKQSHSLKDAVDNNRPGAKKH